MRMLPWGFVFGDMTGANGSTLRISWFRWMYVYYEPGRVNVFVLNVLSMRLNLTVFLPNNKARSCSEDSVYFHSVIEVIFARLEYHATPDTKQQ